MSANKISKNFIKSRFQRISGFFPHPFFADPHEYWIQTLHTHNLSDISLTVLPAYPPVFHMPADLFFIFWNPWFRFENGLPYCGSEEALKQIIQIFYNTIDSKSKKIEQCLKEQLIKDYTIEVHALKSSALLIGAPGLSEAAKELEMYGNAQNLAALEEKQDRCLPCTEVLSPSCVLMWKITKAAKRKFLLMTRLPFLSRCISV